MRALFYGADCYFVALQRDRTLTSSLRTVDGSS